MFLSHDPSKRVSKKRARPLDGRPFPDAATRDRDLDATARTCGSRMFGRRFRNRAGLTPLVAACVGAVSGYYIFNEPLARAARARGEGKPREG